MFTQKDVARMKKQTLNDIGRLAGRKRKPSKKRGRSRRGHWGTWEQRVWQTGDPRHEFHH